MKKTKLMSEDVPVPAPLTTKKQLKEMLTTRSKRFQEAERRRNEPPCDERRGVCVFCKGEVIARVTRKYLGDPMHMIIGPGSRDQMTTIHHGFHCASCGLKYEFPPGSRVTPADEDMEDG